MTEMINIAIDSEDKKIGRWSVRIDEKNRLIFKIENETIEIFQCRTHYGDK